MRACRQRPGRTIRPATGACANPCPVPHAIAIGRRSGGTVGRGGTSRVTVRLKAGTYTYFCPVGSHRAAGMTGRLVVR